MVKDIARTGYVAGAALVAAALVWAFVAHPPANSGEWASWVQAIFSVVAIVAAFSIAELQQLRQRKTEAERAWSTRLELTRACYLACDEAVQTMNYIARKLREHRGQRFRLRSERIMDLRETFQTLLAKDVPAELLRDVLSIQRELSYTQMALSELGGAHEVTYGRINNAESRAQRACKSLKALKDRHHVYQWVATDNPDQVQAEPLNFDEMEMATV